MTALPSLVLSLGIVWPGTQPAAPAKPDPAELREMLHDRQHPLRQSQGALLLVQNSTADAEKIIRQGLKQTDTADIFVALADAVRLCQDGRFVEELTSALADVSPNVRRAAAESLAALGRPDLISRLRVIADD